MLAFSSTRGAVFIHHPRWPRKKRAPARNAETKVEGYSHRVYLSGGFTTEAIKRSAEMSRVLCWTRALPTLRSSLLHRGLLPVDKQAITFSLALVAHVSSA